MDKTAVKRVLAPYCPPLGQSQVEAIASKIADLSRTELAASEVEVSESVAKVAARRRKRSSRSGSRR